MDSCQRWTFFRFEPFLSYLLTLLLRATQSSTACYCGAFRHPPITVALFDSIVIQVLLFCTAMIFDHVKSRTSITCDNGNYLC
ncbi:hypothetical protein BDB00DRAFT_835252 [Zychaea mexicana]|uniref:uncharacterized protein n=1 Tax=Zychaea mexicana TaxID=64656 RepID=UPI0022FED0B8|nr:uncharacterized protein BDB00DRAFT_835252 [Zychaea mexicana]KAI9490953.1 hypothetical protein BDB00DRAFT_835252 [Zychaea mexicana]